jgi:chromosome segregation ATPase
MELEDLVKRVEWLEKENRKAQGLITDLQTQVAAYEGNFSLLREQIKGVGADLSRFTSTAARLEQFDSLVSQYRSEVNKSIEDVEKRREKREREVENRRRAEVENINKSLIDLGKRLEIFDEFKKALQLRADEDARMLRLITDLQKKLDEFSRADDDIRRATRVIDDARKQDAKRLADLSGELAAIRKRADEAREKSDLNADSFRLLDTRLNELLASEAERRQAQMAFIEGQNLSQVERERSWKEMQARFESFTRQTANLDQQLASLEETQRAVKRSQDAFEDMNTRIERRIKEITEIQRLAEDRFRQEWVTFKADDQKRWTNYSLTQDETQKDVRTELEKLNLRVTAVDDIIQTLQDLFQQTSETTETQLQELMNWTHEWLTNHERIMGRSRTVR